MRGLYSKVVAFSLSYVSKNRLTLQSLPIRTQHSAPIDARSQFQLLFFGHSTLSEHNSCHVCVWKHRVPLLCFHSLSCTSIFTIVIHVTHVSRVPLNLHIILCICKWAFRFFIIHLHYFLLLYFRKLLTIIFSLAVYTLLPKSLRPN